MFGTSDLEKFSSVNGMKHCMKGGKKRSMFSVLTKTRQIAIRNVVLSVGRLLLLLPTLPLGHFQVRREDFQ